MRKQFAQAGAVACSMAFAAMTLFAGCGNTTDTSSTEEAVQTTEAETTEQETTESETETLQTEETTTEEVTTEEVTTVEETEETTEEDGLWDNKADISWIDPEKPMVAFAFDDGPKSTAETSSSMRIQKALSDNGQHATFFYWGNSLNDSTAEEIRMAYEAGFEIGNHTWSHPYLTELTEEEAAEDIEKMRQALEDITGEKEFLIRAPYLSTNATVLAIPNVPFVSCGIDTKDWNNATAEEIEDKIITAYENGTLENQILLMHETYNTTAEAVEYLVPYLVENGYQIVTVSELFKANGVEMQNGVVYNNCPKQ